MFRLKVDMSEGGKSACTSDGKNISNKRLKKNQELELMRKIMRVLRKHLKWKVEYNVGSCIECGVILTTEVYSEERWQCLRKVKPGLWLAWWLLALFSLSGFQFFHQSNTNACSESQKLFQRKVRTMKKIRKGIITGWIIGLPNTHVEVLTPSTTNDNFLEIGPLNR